MQDTNDQSTSSNEVVPNDDLGIEALLREVGPRDEPSAQMQNEVRAAVYAEWRAMLDEGSKRAASRKRTMGVGIAATLIAVLAVGWFAVNRGTSSIAQSVEVASVTYLQSEAESVGARMRALDAAAWQPIALKASIKSGADIRTDGKTRLALDFGRGLSLRLDVNSELRLIAKDRAVLAEGRLFVDAPKNEHVPLTIVTPYGAAEHLGTQYQMAITQGAVTVSVREGIVAFTADRLNLQVHAHEVAEVGNQGAVNRKTVRLDGSADELTAWQNVWQWTVQAAPPFDIDNRTLAQFLEWVAHETGRSVTYATPEARRQAETLILHGSVAGLEPETALRAVLATTRFSHDSTADHIAIKL